MDARISHLRQKALRSTHKQAGTRPHYWMKEQREARPPHREFQGEESHVCLLDLSGLHIHEEEDGYRQTFSFLVT